ncbi:MAG: hypothetical protein AB1706_10280 [Pseudomonadota bacterium]
MSDVKYKNLSVAQKAELTGECIDLINKVPDKEALKAVGKMIADFEPDQRNRELLKRAYSKRLKEVTNDQTLTHNNKEPIHNTAR